MIGNFFRTGKTIVIDDKYEEAEPLLHSLYKHQIPHYYSDGRPSSDFPLPANSHFRLIFLDLNLQLQSSMGSSDSDDFKNFKVQHITILEKIVKNINHSYVLIIWSKERSHYEEHFRKIFDNNEKYHTEKRPYKILTLNKADYFQDNKWLEHKQEDLFDEINKELVSLNTYKLFCEWERIVNESSGETFDAIFQLVNKHAEEDKEEHLRKLLTLLSIAYTGDEGYLNLTTDQMRTDSVLLILNQILNDDIDRMILNNREEEYKNWIKLSTSKDIQKLRKDIDRGLINTKLFTYSPNKPELPGSLYEISKSNFQKKIFDDSIKNIKDKIGKIVRKKFKEENDNRNPEEVQKEELIEKFVKEIYKKIIPIELNLTPICDVSQGKDVMHRIIPGFIIPEVYDDLDFFNSGIRNSGYGLSSDIFDVTGLNESIKLKENVFIYFDKRFFTAIPKAEIHKRNIDSSTLPRYLFTLRNNLVNDFQVAIANHISRLGVLYLQN